MSNTSPYKGLRYFRKPVYLQILVRRYRHRLGHASSNHLPGSSSRIAKTRAPQINLHNTIEPIYSRSTKCNGRDTAESERTCNSIPHAQRNSTDRQQSASIAGQTFLPSRPMKPRAKSIRRLSRIMVVRATKLNHSPATRSSPLLILSTAPKLPPSASQAMSEGNPSTLLTLFQTALSCAHNRTTAISLTKTQEWKNPQS